MFTLNLPSLHRLCLALLFSVLGKSSNSKTDAIFHHHRNNRVQLNFNYSIMNNETLGSEK